jgi:hypothetical protein
MELKSSVILSIDDIRMVEDFFNHYNDPKTNNLIITDSLQKEINKFKTKVSDGSYTVEDQRLFTIALCGALSQTSHPLLKDIALKDVMSACGDVWTDAQFYEEFEKAISPQTAEEG